MTYSEHWCSSFTISNCSLIVLLKLFLSFKRTILIALKVWDNHISPIFLWIWRTKGRLLWIGNKISKRLDVSPDFHWQKSSLTMGRNSFCENRLGYLDVAIAKKKLRNLRKWSRKYLVSESWGAPWLYRSFAYLICSFSSLVWHH